MADISDRKPTIIDVASRAGVSIKTVSRVINDEPHVSAAMRDRVRQAVNELGFEANESARGMRSLTPEKSYVVAQLYGDPGGAYTSDVQIGLLSRCHYFGYHLVVEELDYQSPEIERRTRDLVRRLKLDGAVLTAPLTDNETVLGVLDDAGVPYVRVAPVTELRHLPSVKIDEKRAAYQLTQHLLAFGHRRIGFVRGLPNHSATILRFAGFEQAMHEAGLTIDPALIEDGEFRYHAAMPGAHRLLDRSDRPTAIFASNDEMAAAVITVAHEMGLKLPDDCSIVGFDDISTSEMLWPSLTTVRQPVEKLGAAAGDLLFTRLSPLGGPSLNGNSWPDPAPHQILPHDIVLRSSTAPLRRGKTK
ncbi:LacI family DNA-binding transcriptional regulator [Asticcacaulis benevestitus]|uniref:LacI family transcriptional regulator n=1 Tax=Asticcacaulis benevestitus DSM 16100 = ATCC BAA-896 TaxID=1121022 RepID=V4PMJ4_9CAUL|nr:LacI family DNA-binding transcriptional regulator [Asticcacaulis benevestitus]ESQ89476.1 LacI family transcriptional regulator [Asticcacaulis benevestitus DSM 16100 = ATCC BAA-896]